MGPPLLNSITFEFYMIFKFAFKLPFTKVMVNTSVPCFTDIVVNRKLF